MPTSPPRSSGGQQARSCSHDGQFLATQLAGEAEALISATSHARLAETLVAKAEVSRLAGAPGEAEANLRKALRIYEDRRGQPAGAGTPGRVPRSGGCRPA